MFYLFWYMPRAVTLAHATSGSVWAEGLSFAGASRYAPLQVFLRTHQKHVANVSFLGWQRICNSYAGHVAFFK